MKEIIAYQCNHCGMLSITKKWISDHEKRCNHDEINKNCPTCDLYYHEESDIFDTNCWDRWDEGVTGFNTPCKDWIKKRKKKILGGL